MNTKAIVIIVILLFAMLTSVVYAFVQQTIAQEMQREALEQKVLSEAARVDAERCRDEAEKQRQIAERIMGQYQTALIELDQLKKKCR